MTYLVSLAVIELRSCGGEAHKGRGVVRIGSSKDKERLIRKKINLLRDAEPGTSNPSAPYCKP
jgi:hypothetical protein